MEEIRIKDSKAYRTGTSYVVIKVHKNLFKTLPEGCFFMDVIIKDIRGGKKKNV